VLLTRFNAIAFACNRQKVVEIPPPQRGVIRDSLRTGEFAFLALYLKRNQADSILCGKAT